MNITSWYLACAGQVGLNTCVSVPRSMTAPASAQMIADTVTRILAARLSTEPSPRDERGERTEREVHGKRLCFTARHGEQRREQHHQRETRGGERHEHRTDLRGRRRDEPNCAPD